MIAIVQSPAETIQNSLEGYYDAFLKILPRIALAVLVIILGVLLAQFITNFYKKKNPEKSRRPFDVQIFGAGH